MGWTVPDATFDDLHQKFLMEKGCVLKKRHISYVCHKQVLVSARTNEYDNQLSLNIQCTNTKESGITQRENS